MMKILVVADGHYYKNKDGEYYVDSVFDYNFYKRYLSVFDDVYSIVRTIEVEEIPHFAKKASGEKVHFLPIEDSVGAGQYYKNYYKTKSKIKEYIRRFDKAVFRVPGVTANEVYSAWDKHKPYALEVVVDPWEYFAPGTIKSFVRPFVRVFWTNELKRMCRKAPAVSYVTEKYLQNHYPCQALKGKKGFVTSYYSSVELPDEGFAKPKEYREKNEFVISHVAASFATYGKGHITLMKALRIVLDRGFAVKVKFIGDGPLKNEFENFAETLKIRDNVLFTGLLPSGEAVKEVIRSSDLFVFPTMAEGLPRVVLEAMSEGLPVISSPVCGIPEIVQKNCLVEYNDYNGYAEKIMYLLSNPYLMSELSKDNILTALKYKRSVLEKKRKQFYLVLREM